MSSIPPSMMLTLRAGLTVRDANDQIKLEEEEKEYEERKARDRSNLKSRIRKKSKKASADHTDAVSMTIRGININNLKL